VAALAAWEVAALRGGAWLRERWAPRIVATASVTLVTMLVVDRIVGLSHVTGWSVPVWMLWLAAAYVVYRRLRPDVYVLAAGMLSVVVVTTVFLGRHLLDSTSEEGALLLIGLVIIGLSGAGGMWLRHVVAEERER
jgi:hypothetical protein